MQGARVEQSELARILRNWRDERDSAALYEALATIEHNPRLSRVFRRLAESEREHSAYWEERLRAQGQSVPEFRPSLRARTMMQLARQFGVAFVTPSITTRELADHHRYSSQEDASAAGLTKEERGHAAVMRRVAAYGGRAEGEATHSADAGSVGNNLRAAVLGVNDGLASNFCLIMGVAGGALPTAAIILTGVAGLVAGACSMALGEWLSVTNAREMARSLMDADVKELHATTAWKREELALIYEAQGMSEEAAQHAADRIIAQDPQALQTLIGEERVMAVAGIAQDATSAAAYSFSLFAVGACVPLLPFFFASAEVAIFASITLALLALFAVGLLTSFFNGRSPLFSGVRQVGIGAAAAAVTYAAGRLVSSVIG
jgi:VIT1/CCC1 family predicted Fe2+/Mn2+ transporter